MSASDAAKILRKWVLEKDPTETEFVWTRGSLDAMCIDSLFKQVEQPVLFGYNRYRDVRTALDFIYPGVAKNGYIDVDPDKCIGFKPEMVVKHNPVHDSAFDLAMMFYGKAEL